MRVSPSYACLDKFLCIISWEREFPKCLNKSLPRFQSYHNALLLFTNTSRPVNQHLIKFDKSWSLQEGFDDLLKTWWQAYKLDIIDIENSWKFKI
jgi:hypothetical protein